ncbi:DNA-binding GntR family transcriptional regulator [Pseudonocardia eucalypti]|uniref:GntR family transcriptional regulator n=1 Tax=Pseudonocardia eucalypti TaxID=648755 RepID=UPI0016131C60|nr:DNA-binding GntR family transcriptional regulator [Pseudonocardia eucalypti]MBB6380776.1 DNA-binding GntR family transcriptional regulator [Pseudonocardia eucalypti]
MAKHTDIAEQLRTRLRTDEFPVGSTFPAVALITSEYGVSPTTAYRALKHLESLGEVRVGHGTATVVLSEPAPRDPDPHALLAEAREHLNRATALLDELADTLTRRHTEESRDGR